MWLLLYDACSQPQESHDGCFHLRTFLISWCLVPGQSRSYKCHHCRGLHHWDSLRPLTQPSGCTSFQATKEFFKAKFQVSYNNTGNVYSSSHHVKRPLSSSFLPLWLVASRARGIACTGNPETYASSFPPTRREVETWLVFLCGLVFHLRDFWQKLK